MSQRASRQGALAPDRPSQHARSRFGFRTPPRLRQDPHVRTRSVVQQSLRCFRAGVGASPSAALESLSRRWMARERTHSPSAGRGACHRLQPPMDRGTPSTRRPGYEYRARACARERWPYPHASGDVRHVSSVSHVSINVPKFLGPRSGRVSNNVQFRIHEGEKCRDIAVGKGHEPGVRILRGVYEVTCNDLSIVEKVPRSDRLR